MSTEDPDKNRNHIRLIAISIHKRLREHQKKVMEESEKLKLRRYKKQYKENEFSDITESEIEDEEEEVK